MKKLLRIQLYIVTSDTNTKLYSIITRPIRTSVHRGVQEQTCKAQSDRTSCMPTDCRGQKEISPKATYNIELLQPAQTAVMFKLLIF